jgi:hypothetical protein
MSDNPETSSKLVLLPAGVNPTSLFLLWQHLGGNDRLTAAAAGLDIKIVKALSHDFCWTDLAQGRLGMKDEKTEKEVNRAHSYVQAQRLRKLIDRTVDYLEANPNQLASALISTTKDGEPVFSAKPLVELAKAAEAAHSMAYRALGDKVAVDADGVAPDADKIRNLSLTINAAFVHAAERLTGPVKVVSDAKEVIGV